MNSTLKSLVFWFVLAVVVALVWNFSPNFQRKESLVSFSEFISWVDAGQVTGRDAGRGKTRQPRLRCLH